MKYPYFRAVKLSDNHIKAIKALGGNVSQVLRAALEEYAKSRGVWPPEPKPKSG